MSITKLTTNGLNGTKYDNVSADNYYMEPIATTLLGSSQATITFSNIPQGYKHLQIRWLARDNFGSQASDANLQFNSDTSASYTWHQLLGDGATPQAYASTSQTSMRAGSVAGSTATANVFAVTILDLLDYTSTSKYKTVRNLAGYDSNGFGSIALNSGLWMNTAAVTSISISPRVGTTFNTNSRFSLYGIKG